MRKIFLNCWQAKAGKAFFDFVGRESKTTDIFCFQEVGLELYQKISNNLVGFNKEHLSKRYVKSWVFNLAVFVKDGIEILEQYENFMAGKDVGAGMAVKLKVNNRSLLLCSIHGVSLPGNKLDSKDRILQSEEIINFAKGHRPPIIIGGDFNLLPETESIKMFGKVGYRNLINDFKIPSTRNRFAWEQAKKQIKEGRTFFGKQHFADYVFVSPEVKVKNFSVPNLEISDHLSLILDFEI